MLTAKHFENCEIHHYTSTIGICILNSAEAIKHLNTEFMENIYSIGFTYAQPPVIIINYQHLEEIEQLGGDEVIPVAAFSAQPHHMKSFREIHDGPSKYEMICEHEICIHYPKADLLRKIHDLGNKYVKKSIIEFIKSNKYFDIKTLEYDDATWLMSSILGNNNEEIS